MDKKDLKTLLDKKNIVLDDSQILLLEKVMKNTIETNKLFNLTSITDESEFFEKMIYDSLLSIPFVDFKNKTCLDVGTGAGFPGLPLAISCPEGNFTLLDSTKKKIEFINEFVKEENLVNVSTINERVENFSFNHREQFDIAVARAVAPLSILLETIIPSIKVGGYFIAYKGKNIENEIKNASFALKKLNCCIESNNHEVLPFSNEERYILMIKKTAETNKKYPREYSLISSKPL